MRFFSTLLASATLVSAAFGAVAINSFPTSVKAGENAEIKYSGTAGAATTFILRKGPSNDLANITTLTDSATGGSYTWSVPTNIPSGTDYALTIIQGSESNFWGPFAITGGTAASSSAASSASSAASSAASSSASASVTSSGTAVSSTPSPSTNGTVSSATLSTTGRPTASGTPTGSASVPNGTGAASTLGSSPMALLFGAVAAMAYLN